jgi:hypothetical protein
MGVAVTELWLVQCTLSYQLVALLVCEVESRRDTDGYEQACDGATKRSINALKITGRRLSSEDEAYARACGVADELVHADTEGVSTKRAKIPKLTMWHACSVQRRYQRSNRR